MKGLKNKNTGKWKRLATLPLLLIVLGVLINSVWNVYQKRESAQQILTRMEKEAADLENRKIFLKESLAKLNTTEGIEFEIRKKLNVAGAGEGVAIIVEEEQAKQVTRETLSSWQKIKNFFVWLFE